MTRFSLADYYHEWADEDRADELREARALRAAARAVCPTCKTMGGHSHACPDAPLENDSDGWPEGYDDRPDAA